MFQDEARFDRMARIRRCRAPVPAQPVMHNGCERECTHVHGAVSPLEGDLDWMPFGRLRAEWLCSKMNTEEMGRFLAQVSAAHPGEFMLMVIDGASSHVAKALAVPENIRPFDPFRPIRPIRPLPLRSGHPLHRLPPYAPELNPQEPLWDELREKELPNRVFGDMAGVVKQLEEGLPRLAGDRARIKSICAGPWIIQLHLKTT